MPQSRGGKTADHNLVCCHILTNDEKADRFPAFKANGINFEIIKAENHYEIRTARKIESKRNSGRADDVNLMDSASGIRFFKRLKGMQNKPRWVGSVLVRLQDVSDVAVVDFIEKLFDGENVSFSMSKGSYSLSCLTSTASNAETRIVAVDYDMPLKEDISALLDRCILLNTYIGNYFAPMGYVKKYDIFYQVNCFENKLDLLLQSNAINFEKTNGNSPNVAFLLFPDSGHGLRAWETHGNYRNALFINELAYINTEAKEKKPGLDFMNYDYQAYDYSYARLAKNLKREVSEV